MIERLQGQGPWLTVLGARYWLTSDTSGYKTGGGNYAFALSGDTAIPAGLFLTLRIHHFAVSAIISCLGNHYPSQNYEDQVSNDRHDENGKRPKDANKNRCYDLTYQQNRQWRNENRKKVIHRNSLFPDCRRMCAEVESIDRYNSPIVTVNFSLHTGFVAQIT